LHRWVAVAGDVEAVLVVEDGGIAVGRSGPGEDQRACRDGNAPECDRRLLPGPTDDLVGSVGARVSASSIVGRSSMVIY
jgi:hypothetical protein